MALWPFSKRLDETALDTHGQTLKGRWCGTGTTGDAPSGVISLHLGSLGCLSLDRIYFDILQALKKKVFFEAALTLYFFPFFFPSLCHHLCIIKRLPVTFTCLTGHATSQMNLLYSWQMILLQVSGSFTLFWRTGWLYELIALLGLLWSCIIYGNDGI